jgi:hypothetical protein
MVNKKDLEKSIKFKMETYFADSERVESWYNTKHYWFDTRNSRYSPREMVDRGKGDKVLEFIKLVINR